MSMHDSMLSYFPKGLLDGISVVIQSEQVKARRRMCTNTKTRRTISTMKCRFLGFKLRSLIKMPISYIDEEMYPREEGIVFDVRRIPLYYKPLEMGGNGHLREYVQEYLNIKSIYDLTVDEMIPRTKALFESVLKKHHEKLTARERERYDSFKQIIAESDTEYADDINKELDFLYKSFVVFMEEQSLN